MSKLQGHYQKHVVEGKEFGEISQNEYLKMAKEFAKDPFSTAVEEARRMIGKY